ncbi:hypothetical protein FPV67DRAFT_1563158 [Lyophyllum atratum]|nr:hypothetical protein FPV67DRAFT_1563158 [Lyophyllum atratum]
MKFTLSLAAALICIAQASALTVKQRDEVTSLEARTPGPACGDPRTALPLLRAWRNDVSDHFYTTDAAEMNNAVSRLGYVAEGTTGYVFSEQQPGTVPLYRLYKQLDTDHFYTTSASERDYAVSGYKYTSEGVVGYVYADTACGGLPLYRSYNLAKADHFYTMSASERDSAQGTGWAPEGIAAYILPY